MALATADRTQETTNTTGTGTVTLAGAVAGFQSFSTAFSTGDIVPYCITDDTLWEIGVGVFTTAGTTLTRPAANVVAGSSGAGANISVTAGSKVFATMPAKQGLPIKISAKTSAYTVIATDLGAIIDCTSGTFTVTLTAAATLGGGFNFWVINSGTGVITIDPNASETLDGLATSITLAQGAGYRLLCDGSNWKTIAVKSAGAAANGNMGVQLGAGAVAASLGSTAIGRNSAPSASVTATGAGAMALGGSYASGTDSFAAAIANNTSSYGATGANSVAMGRTAKASASNSVAIGSFAQATGGGSVCIGGANDTSSATGDYSVALGDGVSVSTWGKYGFAGGSFAAKGDAQTGRLVLRKATTGAVASVLISDASTAGAGNQLILPNNSAYAFDGIVISRRQAAGGTESAAWKVEGLIRREANAASTTLVASTVTVISNAPGWTLALSADTTNGGLAVTFTGAAATNIRTVATLRSSEVTYA